MTVFSQLSLAELINHSGVKEELIIYFVSNKWIRPADANNMIFDQEDLARIRLIHELQHVMGVNDEAVPVVLHLVDQLNRMHLEIKTLLNDSASEK